MKTKISILFSYQYFMYSNNVFALLNGILNANQEVVYPGIGRFTKKDFFDPNYRPIVLLPESPEKINTKFFLYTRTNFNTPQVLTPGNLNTIKSSCFIAKNPIKFIVHGWIDDHTLGKWMIRMKDEFLKADNYNVIIVEWSPGNKTPYPQAMANTRVVGPVLSQLIDDLKAVFGIDLSRVHILGHSLGSHIAGYAGERLKGKIGRITGLDPAGIYFEGLKDPAAKLDPTDAQFVDAIHTAAHPFGPGMYETSGHLDFYPNGGKNDPSCNQERLTNFLSEGLIEGGRSLLLCNHMRAVDFYIASINNKLNRGVGYMCQDFETFEKGSCLDCGSGDKCAIFGEDAIKSYKFKDTTQGSRFFLITTDKYPYFSQYLLTDQITKPKIFLNLI